MKKAFYSLEFYYSDDKKDTHFFKIGYFSSIVFVRNAIELLKNKNGFCNSGGNFIFKRIYVDFINTQVDKRNVTLFELSHEYLDEYGYDISTMLGLYSSLSEAKERLKTFEKKLPFCKYPNNFTISDVKVNLCEWTEGFESW